MTTQLSKNEVEEEAQRLVNSFEEIERRKTTLTLEDTKSSSSSSLPVVTTVLALPKSVAHQKFFLLNLCGKQQNPRHTDAGFRFLGAFSDMDEVRQHVEETLMGHDCALHVAAQGQTFVICDSLQKQQDVPYTIKKRDEIVEWYAKKRADDTEEFKKAVETKSQGEVGRSFQKIKEKTQTNARKTTRDSAMRQAMTQKLESGAAKRVRNLPRDAELRGQAVVVVDIFDDSNPRAWKGLEAEEPGLTIWGAFPNEEAAEEFMQYYGRSSNVKDRDLFSVDAYEWIWPKQKHDMGIKEKHRNLEEDKILSSMNSEQSRVDKFKQTCAEQGKIIPEKFADPTIPSVTAKMTNDKGEELKVVKGQLPTTEPEKYVAVPKTKEFLTLPPSNKKDHTK